MDGEAGVSSELRSTMGTSKGTSSRGGRPSDMGSNSSNPRDG